MPSRRNAPAPVTRPGAPGSLSRGQGPPPARLDFAAPAAVDPGVVMEDLEEDAALPDRAVIVVACEGEETSDGRVVDAGALTWREPPLSLTMNHSADLIAGRIDAFGRVDSLTGLTVDNFEERAGTSGAFVVAAVTFDLGYDADGTLVNDDALGREVARQVHGGFLLGVSMEVGDEELEWECTEPDPEDPEWCLTYLMHLVAGKIGAVTVCPFQAIESSRVIDVSAPVPLDPAEEAPEEEAMAASAAGPSWWPAPSPFEASTLVARATAPVHFELQGEAFAPPAEWFEDPALDEPTPLTITADGQVYGHIATWGTCHLGRTDVCITPPHSVTDYAYFRTGEVITADGSGVPVGVLTMNTGHADLTASAQETVAHYDHTGTQAMHLAAGEDAHGIWVAGSLAVRELTHQALSVLRAAAPSGDWRRIGGNLELVGVLAVNTPGFPVPRPRTLVASGQQLALVAAAAPVSAGHGCGCGGSSSGLTASAERRLSNLEAIVAALGLDAQAGDALAASLRP